MKPWPLAQPMGQVRLRRVWAESVGRSGLWPRLVNSQNRYGSESEGRCGVRYMSIPAPHLSQDLVYRIGHFQSRLP